MKAFMDGGTIGFGPAENAHPPFCEGPVKSDGGCWPNRREKRGRSL